MQQKTTDDTLVVLTCVPAVADPWSTRITSRRNPITTTEHPEALDQIAQAHLDGLASPAQIKILEADPKAWTASLWRLLDDADAALERARRTVRGPERANVLNDLDDECYRIDEELTRLLGPPTEDELTPAPKQSQAPREKNGVAQLQLSWNDGQLVAWMAGHDARYEQEDVIKELLQSTGGGAIDWETRSPLRIPTGQRVPCLTAPVNAALGWLVALARPTNDERIAPSVRWMGLAAATAISAVAQGRMAPQLRQSRRGSKKGESGTFSVRWLPGLIDSDHLASLVSSVPGAAMVGQQRQEPLSFTTAVMGDITNTIVHTAASQVDVPAPPPEVKDRNDIAEAFLGRLDGSTFTAPDAAGAEISRRIDRWSAPVVGTKNPQLTVQLSPPDESNAWFAQVLATSSAGSLEPFEVVLAEASKDRSRLFEHQASRLERLFPALLRPGGRRRGEVILTQDEAWQLMTEVGPVLTAAGFDVRVPPLSRKRTAPSLRLTAEDAEDSVVGAQQLANVRWSALFDDVELTAAEIAKLAAQARPLVRSRGQWIELDQVDLAEAAAALAERADQTKLTGADMLRHAMGLEGNPLGGGISIAGDGWAADLLRSMNELPENPDTTPEGFHGELRSYQADALSWLNFLDDAGLGGCLALDMGLGKTPTTLAALYANREHGTGLVIAPPAVVGNWAAEARKFIPDLSIHVHHGATRAKGDLSKKFGKVDVVITTYGTAVRDMDQLSEISWGKVVIDEAQAIKNPAAETSQQLRRLDARTRVALTGTPIENGLGDLWAIMDWANAGLVGPRPHFIAQLTPDRKSPSKGGEEALKALNGVLVYRRTKTEPEIAAELPDRIDELDHCAMTTEQIGLYQAVIDNLLLETTAREPGTPERKGAVLAAITALKQICNHPVNYEPDDKPLEGRSGKLSRLNEIMDSVFASDEKMLIFTHFASWGETLAGYLTERTGKKIDCYHGGLARGARDRMIEEFQSGEGAGALVLSLKAGGTGLNLTAANHVVLYDRWWNPAVEDQARDRAWRIGQTKTVIAHRLVCPGTVDERVEEIVAGKRQIANMVLPKSSSIGDLDAEQLQVALGIDPDLLLNAEASPDGETVSEADDLSDVEPVGASS
ncbi:MAG: DEAD/DEAH box helicase [Acidimicrobiia bacterium]|nr:DEAD/DEAH box helicase [Acidimicrobiia bacterium]